MSSAGQALPKNIFDLLEDIFLVFLRVAARRGSNFSFGSVLLSCSRAARCSLVSFFGVTACTVKNKSPRPRPDTSGIPLPRSRKTAPDCVPSGTLNESFPSSVGTSMLPPSASVVKFSGISHARLLPSRRKNGCGATSMKTYRSPGGPVLRPRLRLRR